MGPRRPSCGAGRATAVAGRDTRRSGRARTGNRPAPRGRSNGSGTQIWWMRTSVRSGPRARRTRSVTRMPECASVHDQQLGRAHLVVDRPRRVLAAVGVVDHHRLEHAAGPGVDRDALERRAHAGGTPEVGQVLGSIMQRKTSSRGASKTRVKCSSSRSLTSMRSSRRARRLLRLPPARRHSGPAAGLPHVPQVRVELVEALVPEAPVRRDPVQRAVERRRPRGGRAGTGRHAAARSGRCARAP